MLDAVLEHCRRPMLGWVSGLRRRSRWASGSDRCEKQRDCKWDGRTRKVTLIHGRGARLRPTSARLPARHAARHEGRSRRKPPVPHEASMPLQPSVAFWASGRLTSRWWPVCSAQESGHGRVRAPPRARFNAWARDSKSRPRWGSLGTAYIRTGRPPRAIGYRTSNPSTPHACALLFPSQLPAIPSMCSMQMMRHSCNRNGAREPGAMP